MLAIIIAVLDVATLFVLRVIELISQPELIEALSKHLSVISILTLVALIIGWIYRSYKK
jgi:hypothetical protein